MTRTGTSMMRKASGLVRPWLSLNRLAAVVAVFAVSIGLQGCGDSKQAHVGKEAQEQDEDDDEDPFKSGIDATDYNSNVHTLRVQGTLNPNYLPYCYPDQKVIKVNPEKLEKLAKLTPKCHYQKECMGGVGETKYCMFTKSKDVEYEACCHTKVKKISRLKPKVMKLLFKTKLYQTVGHATTSNPCWCSCTKSVNHYCACGGGCVGQHCGGECNGQQCGGDCGNCRKLVGIVQTNLQDAKHKFEQAEMLRMEAERLWNVANEMNHAMTTACATCSKIELPTLGRKPETCEEKLTKAQSTIKELEKKQSADAEDDTEDEDEEEGKAIDMSKKKRPKLEKNTEHDLTPENKKQPQEEEQNSKQKSGLIHLADVRAMAFEADARGPCADGSCDDASMDDKPPSLVSISRQ